jgi:glycosyltransferase involved in cell wall biosynthesis
LNNLHITLTEFRNASRILKEANSLLKHRLVKIVFVAALHADGLAIDQGYGERLIVHRFILITRNFQKTLLVQFIKYFEFCIRVFFLYKNKNIKIVNVHSLGLLPLGVLLKFLFKAKLIYDIHELETEKNGQSGVRKKISKLIEKFLIKYVDLTIVVSDSIADWYYCNYKIERPLVALNAPNHHGLIKTNHFRKSFGILSEQAILLYQGGLADGRGVKLILEAFQAREDTKIVLVFMGSGSLEQEIKLAASKYKNIFYFPMVPAEVVLEYTSSADFGVHLMENTCLNHYYAMPNKLFEYAMAGLPVLVSNLKDMSDLIMNNRMGIVIHDLSVNGINNAIDDFLNRDLVSMKSNSYRVACENAWEVQEQKLLAAYEANGIFQSENLKFLK